MTVPSIFWKENLMHSILFQDEGLENFLMTQGMLSYIPMYYPVEWGVYNWVHIHIKIPEKWDPYSGYISPWRLRFSTGTNKNGTWSRLCEQWHHMIIKYQSRGPPCSLILIWLWTWLSYWNSVNDLSHRWGKQWRYLCTFHLHLHNNINIHF